MEVGTALEDAAVLDLHLQARADGADGGLVVFQQPEIGLYQRLVESARARLAELELEYGIEKSKVDSIRSRLFGLLRSLYQERDRLRLLVQFRRAFIERLLAEGEEAAEQTAGDYQRESAEKDREYDSTAAALEGKRELNDEETTRLKQLWKKLVPVDAGRDAPQTAWRKMRQPRRHRVARDDRQGPPGVHPQPGLGRRFARWVGGAAGTAVAV